MNRVGRILFDYQNPSDLKPMYSWSELLTDAGRATVVTEIADFLGLSQRDQPEASRTGLVLDVIVVLLELAARGLIASELRLESAILDSSGMAGVGWRDDALRPFPVTQALLGRQPHVFGVDDWRYWILSDQTGPLALVHLDGRAWLCGVEKPSVDLETDSPATFLCALTGQLI